LSLHIAVRDAAGSREFTPEELPVAIGAGDAAIRLPGAGPSGPVAFLGHSAGKFFLQPGPGTQGVTLDGSPLAESCWLNGGEVLRAPGCRVGFCVGADGLEVSVDPEEGDNITVPPVIEASAEPIDTEQADEDVIRPVDFQRAGVATDAGRRRPFPVRGVVLAIAVAILAVSAWFMFAARSVAVMISPTPDSLTVDGGFAIRFGPRYLMLPGTYRVRASLAEYEPLEDSVEVDDRRSQTVQLFMVRLPDRLFVDTGGVTGAEVSLDGQPVGETPLQDRPVPPGSYRLEVSADRYVPYTEDLDVAGGGSDIRRQVALVPDWAEVTVTSEPAGATVVADGEEQGATPLAFDLRSGRHALEIRKAGFKTWRETVDVEPATPLEIPAVVMRPSDGTLVVKSDPSGATVLVDGQFRGRSPVRLELDPGRNYRIEVSQAGYKTASGSLRLSSGQTRTETFQLEAVTGVVDLQVAPDGVELVVDGKSGGSAPSRLELIAIPHRLEFRKTGYVTQSVTVKPTPGIPQRLEIRLLTKEEAALAAIPKSVTTAQGSVLTLVPGGEFTMGTPRGEPGRRANEGLREVKISNPFYVGVREVTNREFREFQRGHTSGTAIGFGLDGDEYPVARVSWQDAAAFCNWLSNQDSLKPAYQTESGRLVPIWPPTNGYRLPTEAEWSWAARYAGRESPPTRYPWGEAMPPTPGSGNFADMSARAGLQQVLLSYNDDYPVTAPVGRFRPNSLGLFDVAGNVSEWTNDLYRAYTGVNEPPAVDPVGAEEGRYYVIRGSSWRSASISDLRWTWRDSADEARPDLGFRIARSIK